MPFCSSLTGYMFLGRSGQGARNQQYLCLPESPVLLHIGEEFAVPVPVVLCLGECSYCGRCVDQLCFGASE